MAAQLHKTLHPGVHAPGHTRDGMQHRIRKRGFVGALAQCSTIPTSSRKPMKPSQACLFPATLRDLSQCDAALCALPHIFVNSSLPMQVLTRYRLRRYRRPWSLRRFSPHSIPRSLRRTALCIPTSSTQAAPASKPSSGETASDTACRSPVGEKGMSDGQTKGG